MPHSFKAPFLHFPFISQYFTDVFKDAADLLPAEASMVAGASAKRQSDFVTGRYCARQALINLRNISPAIMRGENKEPIWPDGVVGSISHSEKMVGAVVALKEHVAAIGLDIETIGRVNLDMWDLIFNKTEQDLIRNKQGDGIDWATLMFSLKESFYKLQYPLTGQFLDFTDILISEVDGELQFSSAKAGYDLNSIGLNEIKTHWAKFGDQLITLCYARI